MKNFNMQAAVKYILENNTSIKNWYEKEHNFTLDDAMNRFGGCSQIRSLNYNVHPCVDQIIEDGLSAGIIERLGDGMFSIKK